MFTRITTIEEDGEICSLVLSFKMKMLTVPGWACDLFEVESWNGIETNLVFQFKDRCKSTSLQNAWEVC